MSEPLMDEPASGRALAEREADRCPVCASASYEPAAVVQSFPARDLDPTLLFVRCDACDLVYANPWPPEPRPTDAAGVTDGTTPPDAGGAKSEAGTRTSSAGMHEDAFALARQLGGRLLGSGGRPLDPAPQPGAREGPRPDRFVLVGALEGDPDPVELLRRIRQSSPPGAELLVIVPNADSLLMRVFGARHAAHYRFPFTAQVPGPTSLALLAAEAGFGVEDVRTAPSRRAWTDSLRNLLVDWETPDALVRLAGSGAARSALARFEARGHRKGRGALLVARLRPVDSREDRPVARRSPFIPRRPAAPVAILGGGVAGLTAARLLRQHGVPAVLFEAGEQIAGLARSFRGEDGFSNDFGAHFITNRFAAALGVGSRCRTVHRFGEAVRLGGRTYSYPFGLMRSPRFVLSAARTRLTPGGGAPYDSVAELYRDQFGPRLAEEVAFPLVEAWAGASAFELAPTVSPPQLDRGMRHVVKLKLSTRLSGRAVANGFSRAQPENPHVYHVYPLDGVSLLTESLAEGMEDVIELRSRVEAIYADDGRVRGVRVGGVDRDVSAVISSAPIHILPRLVHGTDALQPLARFRYRAFTLVNMRFDTRPVLSEVCTWIPDRRFTFFRLTEVPLAMPWLAPEGKTMLTVDIGCEVGDELWTMDEETLAARCLDELEELFPGVRRHYLGASVLRTPVAHPVYLREYEADRIEYTRGLPVEGLYSIGRNGEFAHVLMEDVYWRTRRRVANEILERA